MTFSNDNVDNLITYANDGVSGSITYDDLGRKLVESVNYGSFAKTYSYAYDDHLCTPQRLVDESGGIVWAEDYKAFGEATVTASTVTNNLRFPGQYYDAETELRYYGYRYYSPELGRWLSRDPIGEQGRILLSSAKSEATTPMLPSAFSSENNLYNYVKSNPIDRVDPLGLAQWGNKCPGPVDPACSEERCGPDVTQPVINVLNQIDIDYKAWGTWERAKRCVSLFDPKSYDISWDISQLGPGNKTGECCDQCPTAKCKSTVQVCGQCFADSRVNYVMFGQITKLCGFSWWDVNFVVSKWKEHAYGHPVDPNTLEWTKAGYNGWRGCGAGTPTTPTSYKACKGVCGEDNKTYTYAWGRTSRTPR